MKDATNRGPDPQPGRLVPPAAGKAPPRERGYAARVAVVCDPSTPPHSAMKLVGGLFWRDLARVAGNYRLYPPLRRRAEQLLGERVPELTLGELVALARVTGHPLIRALSAPDRPRVIEALLGNPNLVEDDVLAICRVSDASAESLAAVARSTRWRTSRPVQLALAGHDFTPIPDALRCLRTLGSADLRRLARDGAVRPVVRIAAERLLGRPARPPVDAPRALD